jgi:uncharacterized membrane protein YbaN (DUF454 family)
MLVPVDGSPTGRGIGRLAWTGAGLTCVAVGSIGVVVPGLPTTVFFIAAAACFTRSSPRLERWVLDLPGIGAAVRDHRAGLGMPRRAKVAAIASITAFSGIAVLLLAGWARAAVALAGAVGVAWVAWRVPTKERVLGERSTAR